jgi:hypothetical protein
MPLDKKSLSEAVKQAKEQSGKKKFKRVGVGGFW